jgi:hypothetical protein
LTRSQREASKERDKCHKEGDDAVNNMEMTPGEDLRRGWNSCHNSVAMEKSGPGSQGTWCMAMNTRDFSEPHNLSIKICCMVSEVSWFLTFLKNYPSKWVEDGFFFLIF